MLSYDVHHFEKVASAYSIIEHDLYKNKNNEFLIVFDSHITKISINTAKFWVLENDFEKYEEIFGDIEN